MKRFALAAALAGMSVQGSTSVLHGSLAVQGTRLEFPVSLRVGVLKPGGGYGVTIMPMETYVARVLAGEAVRDSEPAALEALAITIRTFALANRGRHRADDFDLCDQTHCQVLRAAVEATSAPLRRRRVACC
jgi:Sporulation protein and related proteins